MLSPAEAMEESLPPTHCSSLWSHQAWGSQAKGALTRGLLSSAQSRAASVSPSVAPPWQ